MEYENSVKHSIDFLKSKTAIDKIKIDPYWPKWDNPWWHMILFLELDICEKTPKNIIELMAKKIDSHYIHYFPLTESELPENIDPYRGIICHCALGSILQFFHKSGYDYKKNLSWVKEWIEKYQLPDGGYNCEEGAYTKSKKSSVVSTLSIMELLIDDSKLLPSEKRKRILEKGFEYFRKRELIYSSKLPRKIMDLDFMAPTFPRFYYYDVIRCLKFMINFIEEFPEFYVEKEFSLWFDLAKKSLENIKCNNLLESPTLYQEDGKWIDENGEILWKKPLLFPLLEYFQDESKVILKIKEEYSQLFKKWKKITKDL
jgi:hypothetical protein